MRPRRRRGFRAFAAVAVAAGISLIALRVVSSRLDGPWGMLPGGAFRGAETDCRRDWSDLADLVELELELRPEAPRSITIWSVVLEGVLYLPADFLTGIKRWPHQLAADPRIRVRAAGAIHRCRADRVTDSERIAALRRAIAAKYAIDPEGWAASVDVWWFRVGPASLDH